MNIQFELYIIFIHMIVSIILVIYILLSKPRLRKEYIGLIILVPIAGPLLAITVELMNVLKKQGKKELDLLSLSLGDDILWKPLKQFQEDGNIVPLEEAMLINDFKTRRRIMLDALYDEPMKYLDVLLVAKDNDDIETTHYATTMIAHAQKRFHLSAQEYAVAVEKDPNNFELLDAYINMLEIYINSGLLEKYLLRNQRIIYLKMLDKKLLIEPNDKLTLIKKLRNCIELGDYLSAIEVNEKLKQNWRDEEQTWLETIRLCVEGKDQKRLQETITEINRTQIDWTWQGKEEIAIWLIETSV